MKSLFALLSLALITSFANPVIAQEVPTADPSKPPCMTVDDAKKALTANGEKFVEISIKSLLGVDETPTTNLMISTLQGTVVVGIEIGDGVGNDQLCALHPIGTVKAVAGS